MIPIRDPRGRVIAFGGRILGRRRAQISQLAPTRRSSTRAARSTISTAPPRQPHRQAPDRRRGLYGRDRARPRRHRRGGRAQRHRGHRSPARAHVAARSRADPVLRRRQRAGARPRSAPRSAPSPTSAPTAPCASSSCPPARTPTMSCAAAAEKRSRPCSPPPSRSTSACGATSRPPPRSTTPEARAGLRQRLIDHASAIGDPALARLYREQWLERFERRHRAAAQPAGATNRPAPAAASPRAAFVAPDAAGRRRARARSATGGIDRAHRALAHRRLRQFPRGAARAWRAASPRCRSPIRCVAPGPRRAGRRRLFRRGA